MDITLNKNNCFTLTVKNRELTIDPAGRLKVTDGKELVELSGPGEYEAKGFSVLGLKLKAYIIEVDEVRVGYLTKGETVDLLITDSWEEVKNSQPGLVVPLNADCAAAMIKASGLEAKKEKKLSIQKLSLPEETELVILEAK